MSTIYEVTYITPQGALYHIHAPTLRAALGLWIGFRAQGWPARFWAEGRLIR